jgi:Secretion system C-terminal sorting domain
VEMVERFVIEPAYPNPFNPEAQFRFAVNRPQAVRIALYDVLGRQVRVLYAGDTSAGQMHTVRLDGRGLPSGTYLVRIVGERFVETQTVTLLK